MTRFKFIALCLGAAVVCAGAVLLSPLLPGRTDQTHSVAITPAEVAPEAVPLPASDLHRQLLAAITASVLPDGTIEFRNGSPYVLSAVVFKDCASGDRFELPLMDRPLGIGTVLSVRSDPAIVERFKSGSFVPVYARGLQRSLVWDCTVTTAS